jgi:cytoskeletal protein CcmA (bactofilin family)
MKEEHSVRVSSVLGETGVIVGNVGGTGDFEVRGRVQGTIRLKGRVLVGETGVVLGSIEATTVTVLGRIQGDIVAEDGLLVGALGRVEGNLSGPRIAIEAGARVRGVLRAGDDGEREPQVSKATTREEIPPPPQTQPMVDGDKRVPLPPRDGGSASPRDRFRDAEKREFKPIPSPGKLRPPKKTKVPHSDSATSSGGPAMARSSATSSGGSATSSGGSATSSGGSATSSGPPPAPRPSKENMETPNEAPAGRTAKKSRRRGAPTMPTFVKGTKGHQRN